MIVIYGKSKCPYCEKAKGICPEAMYVDLEERQDMLETFRSRGFKTVPIVYVDDLGYIGGYNELKEYLDENR